MYRCPLCAATLSSDARTYRCPHGHTYDRAREGYVNLLVGGGARRRAGGDDPGMVRNRRLVLDADHFNNPRSGVLERVEPGTGLDVGCGEGFYSRPLDDSGRWVGGVDLAKTTVRLAARRTRLIEYADANAFTLPGYAGPWSSIACSPTWVQRRPDAGS